jgi:hypothetical protein
MSRSASIKIQLTQELKPTDHGKRKLFAEWILNQLDADFASRIIFGDEDHFHLSGYVNK